MRIPLCPMLQAQRALQQVRLRSAPSVRITLSRSDPARGNGPWYKADSSPSPGPGLSGDTAQVGAHRTRYRMLVMSPAPWAGMGWVRHVYRSSKHQVREAHQCAHTRVAVDQRWKNGPCRTGFYAHSRPCSQPGRGMVCAYGSRARSNKPPILNLPPHP